MFFEVVELLKFFVPIIENFEAWHLFFVKIKTILVYLGMIYRFNIFVILHELQLFDEMFEIFSICLGGRLVVFVHPLDFTKISTQEYTISN